MKSEKLKDSRKTWVEQAYRVCIHVDTDSEIYRKYFDMIESLLIET